MIFTQLRWVIINSIMRILRILFVQTLILTSVGTAAMGELSMYRDFRAAIFRSQFPRPLHCTMVADLHHREARGAGWENPARWAYTVRSVLNTLFGSRFVSRSRSAGLGPDRRS